MLAYPMKGYVYALFVRHCIDYILVWSSDHPGVACEQSALTEIARWSDGQMCLPPAQRDYHPMPSVLVRLRGLALTSTAGVPFVNEAEKNGIQWRTWSTSESHVLLVLEQDDPAIFNACFS